MAATGIAIAGWSLFWFLTDDAHIAFRYVDQAMSGNGYVWNPPPFRPVEGYTSFLWVILLHATWALTGIEPPVSANGLSLAFGLASLGLAADFVLRMRLSTYLEPQRLLWFAFVLLFTVTNRTWLTWLSSGLETACVNFFITLWIWSLLVASRERASMWMPSVAAAGVALSRPEGLLFVAATLVLLLLRRLDVSRGPMSAGAILAGGLPLLVVPVHLLWRRSFYGEWLPNTYYAKGGSPWPEAGMRYLTSFVLEYALFPWMLIAGSALVFAASRRPIGVLIAENYLSCLVIGTIGSMLVYYTFIVGGDHFEYRIYSFLIPLLGIVFLWSMARLGFGTKTALLSFVLWIVLSWMIPWTHWAHTRQRVTREETFKMRVPIAEHVPWPARGYVAWFDTLQHWLISRSIGMRHQEHKVFYETQRSFYPSRQQGLAMDPAERQLIVLKGVGVPGWQLPHLLIVDYWGLNDHTIARTAERHTYYRRGPRQMAHNRQPPDGYVECFLPTLEEYHPQGIFVLERLEPLTDARIRACEARQWPERPKNPLFFSGPASRAEVGAADADRE